MIAFLAALMLTSLPARAQVSCDGPQPDVSSCWQSYLPQPKVPDESERTRINSLIKNAFEKQKAADDATLKAKTAKAAIASGKSDMTDDAYIALVEKAKRLTADKWAAFHDVVDAAKSAYGLVPPRTSFKDDPNALYTHVLPWSPRFSEQEANHNGKLERRNEEDLKKEAERHTITDSEGRSISYGPAAAWTDETGAIVLYGVAFEKDGKPDADILASYIAHETVHWIWQVRSGGNVAKVPVDYYQNEQAAYTFQAAVLSRLGRDDSPAKQVAAQYARQAELSRGMSWREVEARYTGKFLDAQEPRAPFSAGEALSGGNSEKIKLDGEAEFLDTWRSDIAPLMAERRKDEAWEAARRKQDAEELREATAEVEAWEQAQLKWEADLKHTSQAWDYLVALVHTACVAPYDLEDQARDGAVYDVGLPADLIKSWAADWKRDGALSACQVEVMKDIADYPGMMPLSAVVAYGRKYVADHAPRIKVPRSFSEARDSYRSSGAPIAQVRPSAPAQSGESHSFRSDWSSLSQARGISVNGFVP